MSEINKLKRSSEVILFIVENANNTLVSVHVIFMDFDSQNEAEKQQRAENVAVSGSSHGTADELRYDARLDCQLFISIKKCSRANAIHHLYLRCSSS